MREKLLPSFPHLKRCHPFYQALRPGDVRHSEAAISKAARLLGYQPTPRFASGARGMNSISQLALKTALTDYFTIL